MSQADAFVIYCRYPSVYSIGDDPDPHEPLLLSALASVRPIIAQRIGSRLVLFRKAG